jgi:septal ring factor EnvC (AmiA/AmiB activator)
MKHYPSHLRYRAAIKRCSVVLIVLLAFSLNTSSQNNRKDLEQKRKQKEQEIALTKKLLKQTEEKKEKTINQWRLLGEQIKIREELIGAVSNEIKGIDEQIDDTQAEIKRLEIELNIRKIEYSDMLFVAYKTRNAYNQLAFYFSSKSFNQALKRFKYVQQLGESRRQHLKLILETTEKITVQLNELQEIRGDKADLLQKKETEKISLEVDRQEQNIIAQDLKRKEADLKIELAAKEKAAQELDQQLKRIIATEIEAERKRAKAGKSASTSKSKAEISMTPEAKALSNNFNANRGKLPWPVEKGFIIRGYGEHEHPTLKGIKTVNNGIDIVTEPNSNARAVFEGEVRAIFNIPGMQNAVMINHGEFFTVYTHLDKIYVKKGDKIKIKDKIGSIHVDDKENKWILHFEMWMGSNKMNPADWIYK